MAATKTPEPNPATDPASDPARPLPRRAWWHRSLPPEERRRILNDLAVVKIEDWAFRFTVMLTLSVVVAVMGLSLNSAAVVIGAMLLAPLMQPVLAAGACLSIALFSKSLVALTKVAVASVWCIGIAYLISMILPESILTPEILARTQPDIKDLVVALAAGAAGAYATVRSDVSSSLPGVAVAVALVPPLAAVGVLLDAGATSLAFGALLLYITNLAAIVFASIVVFVATGFVPPRRLSDNLMRLTLASVAIVAVVIVIAVPLYNASIDSIDRNTQQREAEAIVDAWLGPLEGRLERTVSIRRDSQQVVVEIRGFDQPPDQEPLVSSLKNEFPGYDVPVQWIRAQPATTTTEAAPEPTEQLVAEIRMQVEAWLDESGLAYQLDDVRLDGRLVRIDAAGIGDPPDMDLLLPRLAAIDETLSPGLNWATLATITEEPVPTPVELNAERMELAVEQWANSRNLVVQRFSYDGERAVIDVAGSSQPDITQLEFDLWEIADAEIIMDVYFTQRQLVTTTTTTTPPPETR